MIKVKISQVQVIVDDDVVVDNIGNIVTAVDRRQSGDDVLAGAPQKCQSSLVDDDVVVVVFVDEAVVRPSWNTHQSTFLS